jgi:hypothetical protein
VGCSQKPCTLLDDWLGKSLQLVLAAMGMLSLLAKKHIEEKSGQVQKRSFQVWFLDVAKQAVSGVCAHFAGLLNSMLLSEGTDTACAWCERRRS